MAKNGNTFAKLQRETLKRQKAEAKRGRRQKRKEPTSDSDKLASANVDLNSLPGNTI
jgi:hypothetical protein